MEAGVRRTSGIMDIHADAIDYILCDCPFVKESEAGAKFIVHHTICPSQLLITRTVSVSSQNESKNEKENLQL